MRLRHLPLLLCLLLPVANAHASETPAEHAANVYAQQEIASHPLHTNLPDYSLSPADLAKSQQLSEIRVTMHFVDEIWDIISLLLLLWLGVIAWMRDTAVKATANRWGQGYLFLALWLIVTYLLSLPLDIYTQHLSRAYGLSVQSWPSWFGDQAKGFGIGYPFGGLLFMLLFWVIRKFGRSWWLIFWAICVPILLLIVTVSPYISHLFNKYEPLTKHNAALVARLEEVVQKGHMDIPPERMFLMKASEKVTTLNADVEGFGASKRVVVWDNTINKMSTDQITFVFGHESGHYVLNHIVYGIAFGILGLLVTFFLAYYFIQWAIARFGPKWGVPHQGDWAAFAVLMLAFSLFGLFSEPIQSTFSRMDEHAADVYGQEAIHGLVQNPQNVAETAFQILGSLSYADPNPSPLYEFWTYSHPAIGRRAAFAHAYDPWAPGAEPKYFKKQ